MAFFFLFFLHGTSIGTRQQGISYKINTSTQETIKIFINRSHIVHITKIN